MCLTYHDYLRATYQADTQDAYTEYLIEQGKTEEEAIITASVTYLWEGEQ